MQGRIARQASRRRPRLARAAVVGAAGAAVLGLAPAAMAVPAATLQVNPMTPDLVKASTYSGTFILHNQSSTEAIDSFTIDLRDGPALFYDFAFDPADGTPAGDTNAKGFERLATSDEGVTGGATYSAPEGGGFAVLAVATTGLIPGKQLKFAIDIDPTSTQDTPGHPPPHQASVSGAELHGAKVTVRFSDGSVLVNDIVRNPAKEAGADWKGNAKLRVAGVPPMPGLQRLGGAVSPAKVPTAQQSVVVSGPAGAAGVVLVSEGHLVVTGSPHGGFDLDPFEANMAVKFTEVPFTIGPGGTVTVPVTLTDSPPPLDPEADPVVPFTPLDTGLNYITAYLMNGVVAGPVTPPIVLQVDPSVPVDTDPPAVAGVAPADGAAGQAVDANVTVKFDEPMSAGTITAPGAFTLVDGAGAAVPAAITGNGTGTEFTLDPNVNLAPAATYTAKVAASVADLAGNPLGAERAWSFTTARGTTTGPDPKDPPKPPDDPNAPWCLTVAKRPTNGSKGAIRLEASQLLISQRIAQAAVRRANAIEGWLADGIATQDLCGNTFLAPSFGPGVALGEGGTATPTFANPRPIPSGASRRNGAAAAVKLEAAQLLINQRISQAAVRRVNALAARLEAGLSGGDIRDGAITAEKLRKGLTVTSAASAGDPVPPSRTILKGRSGGGGRVTVSVRQLQINQRISQAAVRRVNALQDRLMAGLTAADFREGSIGAAKLAPELRGAGAQ